MNRRNLIRLAVIAILFGIALSAVLVKDYDLPGLGERGNADNTMGMSLGLDLSGGIHLVYRADLSEIGNETADEAIDGVIDIISRRVDAYGVSEPVIQKQGADRISVQLPGVRDMEAAVELVGQTAELEFRVLSSESWENTVKPLIEQGLPVDYEAMTEDGTLEWVPATGTIKGEELHLTGKYLKRTTRVVIDQRTNEPRVAFELDSVGAELFSQITSDLYVATNSRLNRPLGIFLDESYVSSPTVQSQITGGSGVIENIPLGDAQSLAILLNAGALPVPLEGPIIREDIDPTLGADSVSKSIVAAAVGLALVLVFMIAYYRLPGLMASVALIIYATFVLAAFKLFPVTLTLAGLAAFILSIGMAVDANVLIFERLKEELRAGRTLGASIEAGFNRAWTAIRDSNISTLITCGILYWMGSVLAEPRVMGFALTLAIGVVLSMFTAIFVTRTFLRLYVGTRLAKELPLFGGLKVRETSMGKEPE